MLCVQTTDHGRARARVQPGPGAPGGRVSLVPVAGEPVQMVRGDDTIDSQVSLPYVDRACQFTSTGFGVEHLRYLAGASSSERVPGTTIALRVNQATSRKRYSGTLLGIPSPL